MIISTRKAACKPRLITARRFSVHFTCHSISPSFKGRFSPSSEQICLKDKRKTTK